MDYHEQNKKAWEEAFENRHPGWGSDVLSKILERRLHFFEKDMARFIRSHDLAGKNVGHFCCNNGRELLSLVSSQGATYGCGFDIAENQIRFAKKIAEETGVNCEFLATNILDIDKKYYNKFDMIIITIGSLCWFKDLNKFFSITYSCLKTNGTVLINEQHPIANTLGLPGDDNYDASHPAELKNSYFYKEWINNDGMYYLTKKKYDSETFIDYTHSMGKIINAIISNGMTIKSFTEYDYDLSGSFSELNNRGIPLSYVVEAQKRG